MIEQIKKLIIEVSKRKDSIEHDILMQNVEKSKVINAEPFDKKLAYMAYNKFYKLSNDFSACSRAIRHLEQALSELEEVEA